MDIIESVNNGYIPLWSKALHELQGENALHELQAEFESRLLNKIKEAIVSSVISEHNDVKQEDVEKNIVISTDKTLKYLAVGGVMVDDHASIKKAIEMMVRSIKKGNKKDSFSAEFSNPYERHIIDGGQTYGRFWLEKKGDSWEPCVDDDSVKVGEIVIAEFSGDAKFFFDSLDKDSIFPDITLANLSVYNEGCESCQPSPVDGQTEIEIKKVVLDMIDSNIRDVECHIIDSMTS